jgi:dimethylhistidine N-methyltransferase
VRPPAATTGFGADVASTLSRRPRRLPSCYLYDALGSALFDAICLLPWYGITRAELALLAAHARDIARAAGPLTRVVELGPGNGEKLAVLLGALAPVRPAEVHLVDISSAALNQAARRLSHFAGLRIFTHQGRYGPGLRAITGPRQVGWGSLVALLGSNIGNFDPQEARGLLRQIRAALGDGDSLLIGADLRKAPDLLLRAYDDPLGVTAAFNRNLLERLNRELEADIDLNTFEHRAMWCEEHGRIEMHLVSTMGQRISIPGANISVWLDEGESIWTESSYKHDPAEISALIEGSGFSVRALWREPEAEYALILATT